MSNSSFAMTQQAKKYVLNLDLDNSVADYSSAVKGVIMEAHPHLKESDFPPMIDYCFVESKWPTLATISDFQQKHVEGVNKDFLANLEPYDYAVEALNNLHDAGIHIRVVSHRLFLRGLHQKTVVSTASWLDKVGIPYDELVLGKYKSDFVANALVDDSPSNITSWRETYGSSDLRPCFVFGQPYNQEFKDLRYYADNWRDMEQLIIGHKQRIGL